MEKFKISKEKMVNKILILVSFILFTYSFFACVKAVGEMVSYWNLTLNISSSSDISRGVVIDSQDNIIVVGYDRNTTPTSDQWRIMKFNSNGQSLWNYTINPSSGSDQASGVSLDSQDNIIVVGYDRNTTPVSDQWRIMKFNPDGQSIWSYTTDESINNDQANDVVVDSQDNIIVVGYDRQLVNDDQWRIMKFTSDGQSLWNYTINPSSGIDQANGVYADSNNNIIVVGRDANTTKSDQEWGIIKLNSNGIIIWEKQFNLNVSDTDEAQNVVVDSQDNIIVVGYDRNTTPVSDQWRIMKFNPDGQSIWNYTVDPSSSYDQAFGADVDSQDNIIVVGYDRNTTNGDNQWRIMKFNSNGQSIWNYTVNPNNSYDGAYAVAVDSQDNIIVVGYDTPDILTDRQWRIMKFTLCGNGYVDTFEDCDYKSIDPDSSCDTNQYCNNFCRCLDLFDVWIEPSQMLFTVAQKTPVNLYIKNTGYYTDSYSIEAINPNPTVIEVDLSGSTPTMPIDNQTTELVRPWITVFATTTSEDIIFNVTSSVNPKKYKTTTLSVLEGIPISLYEFNIMGIIVIIFLAGIVYFIVVFKT